MNTPVKPPRSILDPEFVYVPSDETNIAVTFQRAKMRTYVEDDYADVERDHHMAFVGGFKS